MAKRSLFAGQRGSKRRSPPNTPSLFHDGHITDPRNPNIIAERSLSNYNRIRVVWSDELFTPIAVVLLKDPSTDIALSPADALWTNRVIQDTIKKYKK